MTILDCATRLRAREVSSSELTASSLARIAKLDPILKTFITVMEEEARACALAADRDLARGIDHGPLHGVPVAVKDVFSTRGVRTTCGSRLFQDHVPAEDAAVVERLKAAGAVIVGKTNMHELAYGITSSNPHFGSVRNPWDTQRIPGGSSGGSASAVAAGMVAMAMGSDTGGSIRIPASFCGLAGLKPTSGRVSRRGVMPLDFSLDHMGPLTRTVRDAAVALQAIAGHDPLDDTSSRRPVPEFLPPAEASLRGVRVGLPEGFWSQGLSSDAAGAVRSMAELAVSLGGIVEPVRVPDVAALNTVGRVILLSEASALMEPYLARRGDFGADVLALLDQGRLLPATDYINAQRLRRSLAGEFSAVWSRVDCLFTATTPTAAPLLGQTTVELDGAQEDTRLATTRLVRSVNVLGVPAVSLPAGFTAQGLPLGLQIIGPAFSEPLILRVAAALEDATGYWRREPPLAVTEN